MKITSVYICIIIALFCFSASAAKPKTISFVPAFPNVNILYPVDLDGYNGNVYVTSLLGQVYKFVNRDNVQASAVTTFFDLTDPRNTKVPFWSNWDLGGDEGLLSLEFHPQYPTVPKFYTFSSTSNTSIQVTAWKTNNGNVDYNSADALFSINKPLAKFLPDSFIYEAYLGGDLRFNKEEQEYCDSSSSSSESSYSSSSSESSESSEDHDRRRTSYVYNLYISVGFGNDETSSPNVNTLLGKILRITPKTTTTGYTIPCSNPYVGATGLDEIYAKGFRNPRKMTFAQDPEDLFVGDVGNNYDEVNRIQESGGNYGYPTYDGCTPNHSSHSYEYPIYTYTDSSAPHTITLGPYYTGPIKSLKDRLLFADLYSGQVYSIQTTNTKDCATVPTPVAVAPAAISAWVVIDNVVYVTNVFGAFYQTPNFYKLVEA
jgi:hypothetical protein